MLESLGGCAELGGGVLTPCLTGEPIAVEKRVRRQLKTLKEHLLFNRILKKNLNVTSQGLNGDVLTLPHWLAPYVRRGGALHWCWCLADASRGDAASVVLCYTGQVRHRCPHLPGGIIVVCMNSVETEGLVIWRISMFSCCGKSVV